jgi:hypothetical protein
MLIKLLSLSKKENISKRKLKDLNSNNKNNATNPDPKAPLTKLKKLSAPILLPNNTSKSAES